MKVFQIGFNKCGTTSLYDFFNRNGHTSVHFDNGKWQSIVESNLAEGKLLLDGLDFITFFSDITSIQYNYKTLAVQYPESKFIYNIRNLDNWLASKSLHRSRRVNPKKKGSKKYFYLYGSEIPIEQYWKIHWLIHRQAIEDYFIGVQSKRLLIFDIEKDTGEKIANFLPELKFDDLNFLHLNKTADKYNKELI